MREDSLTRRTLSAFKWGAAHPGGPFEAADAWGLSVVELDRFVAGLIVCPELIPPSDWLAEVWGKDPEFDDIGSAEAALEALMEHYNRIAHALAHEPEAYAPIFEIDESTGQVLWEAWIGGFERAMRLRMEAWERIVRSDDEEAAMSVNLILAMHALVEGTSELTEEAVEELERMAPGLTQVQGRKVGRNELCRCGSGRKYKRCCASHCKSDAGRASSRVVGRGHANVTRAR